MSRRKDHEKDEFDAFAQARTASFDAAKNRSVVFVLFIVIIDNTYKY